MSLEVTDKNHKIINNGMKLKNIKFFNLVFTKLELWFLLSIIFVFSLLRVPSLIEPYWYGDEGIYQVIGQALRSGRLLYEGIWDNKPPILYLLYAIVNGDLFLIRFLSLVVGALSIFFFFLLSKKLLQKKVGVYISTTIFALIFALPVIEGNIANAENFMLLPIILSIHFILLSRNTKTKKYSILAGLFLSIAFLIKIVAIFDFFAILLIIFLLKFYDDPILSTRILSKNGMTKAMLFIKQEFIFILSFLIPIFITSIYFLIVGAFMPFYRATFYQNIGYVGYGNTFLFPMGLLFLKLVLILLAIFVAFSYRKKIGFGYSVIFLWLAFSIFNALFASRPYTHYLLVLLPSLSLFIGMLFSEKKLLKFTIPIAVIVWFLITSNFGFYTKIIPYYNNYLNFVLGKKSVVSYRAFFDRRTPKDYELAQFINLKTSEQEGIFIWGDSGQIYALSNKLPPGRYIVAYHITFYEEAIDETKKVINTIKPKFIIQTKDHPAIENFLSGYSLRYKISDANIYEREF